MQGSFGGSDKNPRFIQGGMKFYLPYSNRQWKQLMTQPLGEITQGVHCEPNMVKHCWPAVLSNQVLFLSFSIPPY